MSSAHLLTPRSVELHWECPNCVATAVTHRLPDQPGFDMAEMHDCRGMRGLSVPMVPAGQKCKVEAVEREDYLGEDAGFVRLDGEGRPIAAVVTTRDDGDDRAVYAPTAHAQGGRHE